MGDRVKIAKAAARGLREFAPRVASTPVMIGFDGFVDSIVSVVDKRQDAENYTPFDTIDAFGSKIVEVAGESSNFELVVTLEKLGGNGPIMASAMAALGFGVSYVGNLGFPTMHPVFDDFSNRVSVHSIAEPGYTDALEFMDGKLMMGKHQSLKQVEINRIDEVLGRETFAKIVKDSDFIGMVNWTMLTKVESIYRVLLEDIIPAAGGERKRVFVDLADPGKRKREDIAGVLELLGKFENVANVTLGLNLSESNQVAKVFGIAVPDDAEAVIEGTAKAIREKMCINTVVIHSRTGAAAAIGLDGEVASAKFAGPFVAKPKLSTGAGDSFNAGFSLGQLAGFPVEQCLCVAAGTSGYYVRNAGGPTLDELARFCDELSVFQ